MRRLVVFTLLWVTALVTVSAQDEEYKMELGGGVGLMTYYGDFNEKLFTNMQFMGAVVAKYHLNPRMAVAVNGSFGKLKGDLSNIKTYYPDYEEYSFSNTAVDVSFRFEYNFFAFGSGLEYLGQKRFTPFIALGFGTTFVSGEEKNVFTANIPLGFGVKYKISRRVNASLEWMFHISMSDKLDGVEDPYGIKSSGLFKNTDCYSTLQLSLTYDIWPKCKTCHNDRE